MKPKNPSGAKGGEGRRAPQNPQKKTVRRGAPLPKVLPRMLSALIGGPPKQAKRAAPTAKKAPQPEAAPVEVEEEAEEAMPEINVPPPERPEETVPQEIAGSAEQKEQPASEATRRAVDILAKALSDAEAVLVGAPPEQPPVEPPPPPPLPEPPAPAPLAEMPDMLRMLTEHFDRALDRMADERRILIDEAQSAGRASREHAERALDRMEQDRRFLTEQVTSLGRALERLEHRLDDLSRIVSESRRAPITVAIEEEAPLEEEEPAFNPGEEGLTLVISAVPGFQGLMEVQRALSRMPEIEGASVERYFDGEARIVLTLREPITPTRLLEALIGATGQALQIEESRPEAMRMRVRFQAGEG